MPLTTVSAVGPLGSTAPPVPEVVVAPPVPGCVVVVVALPAPVPVVVPMPRSWLRPHPAAARRAVQKAEAKRSTAES